MKLPALRQTLLSLTRPSERYKAEHRSRPRARRTVVQPLPGRSAPPQPARLSRRRARRTLAFGLGFILLFHLALIVQMETAKPEWRDPEYGYRYRNIRLFQADAPDRPIVIALGSSRTQMGLSPAHMPIPETGPAVFNLGRSGAGPIRLAMNLQRLRSAGLRPHAVIIEYMPSTFCTETVDDVIDKQAPMLSYRDVETLTPYCDDPAALRLAWAKARMNSFYTSRLTLLSHLQSGWLPWPVRQDYLWTVQDPHGWMPYVKKTVTEAEREAQLQIVRSSYFPVLQGMPMKPRPEQALRDMIASCQRDGVRVALFVMPESPQFKSWYSTETSCRSREMLEAITRETGVPVFDASAGFAETDFADGHHMLRGPAAVFSERLWREHLEPWLAKQ